MLAATLTVSIRVLLCWLKLMLLDRIKQLWPIETKDDIASHVGDRYTAVVAAAFAHELFVSFFVGFDVFFDIRDAKVVKPLCFGVAKCAPTGAVDSDLWSRCVAHKEYPS